jgi:hypothetical protein
MRAKLGALAFSLAIAGHAQARAPDRAECEAAHLRAQELRKQNQLLGAREQLYRCAAKACPGLVQEDCAQWVNEVERNIPSLVPAAKTSTGRELVEVRVLAGERVLAERLDGKPIELDPGPYTLRFEARGSSPVSVDVVAQAGVKNRVVEATFPVTDAKPEGASPPLPFWILAGVGTVAVGSFATFAILGQEQYSDLEERCAPGCDTADSDSVRTKFLIADVSLVIAALAYGGAAYFYFAAPAKRESTRRAPRVGVVPTRGGGSASFEARF